ncbi:MAG: aspartate/glutamate racemase family protein [Pseudomonadota bacterium]
MRDADARVATLGILMLETRFPRPPGDIGHPDTWPFPVRYHVVRGASPARVVAPDPWAQMAAFVDAGLALVDAGCDGIATTCGFLVPFQDELTAALGVPVATSSLLQVPWVARMLPKGKCPGILTISSEALVPAHLSAAGIVGSPPIIGTDPNGEFARRILGDEATMDHAAAERDVVRAAERLVTEHPAVGAIVLECTNMVPFAPALQRATGLPVYSVYTLLIWFHAALRPRVFAREETQHELTANSRSPSR